MFPPQKTRDLARILIASEADTSTTSLHTEAASVRVYERLRRQLGSPVGVDGFQALASRALSLAKSQSPRLSAVQVTANGGKKQSEQLRNQDDTDEDGEIGIILIAQLLGLFLTLLGEAATVRLIDGAPLQIEVTAKLDTTVTSTSAAGTSYFGPFEDILLEADQLRNVSERLETLADKHVGIEEVLSVAGNIRNIATVLDIFTLIRSKAGGSQDDAPVPPTNGYVN